VTHMVTASDQLCNGILPADGFWPPTFIASDSFNYRRTFPLELVDALIVTV
jgi:hypothetical protein